MFAPQLKIAATYMRGGTSKGLFFKLTDLPIPAQTPGAYRDALLLRALGSPDPYGKQIDGMGGGSSSTSKAVIVSRSQQAGHDVDYLFGQIAIDKPLVDWSGNCGNLSAAVGAFAIHAGLINPDNIPPSGLCTIKIWQANIGKTIIAHVPISHGQVQETGEFELDGVTFPAAELAIEFMDPAAEDGALFPTGNLVDVLEVPTHLVASGALNVTLINAGIPTIFINARELGYLGNELQEAINNDEKALVKFEALRALGAIKMGLMTDVAQAKTQQHIPKIAFIAPPMDYVTSSGKKVASADIDVQVRALSMGKLHHAMMGTAAVAIATAAAIPGTLVNLASGGTERNKVTFGHPSGTLTVGAEAKYLGGQWQVTKAMMSRSARVLMEGKICVDLPNHQQ
ncbi:2-methylaconitate cis-trans isomerase PrpF [Shewanella sp. SNU WT4]|uniref:2-methylaconitate cis-trans isomerase PrpF n=1 Tax=Shewanella sp. SNU WT4 TaxID=2590015 RepID=UPI0011287EF6|nr:2-methylaconitate cis-trans isomerase PrpF [Shewanella sp. SNU WT4]QDF68416.1 2-methylaconitate cis-trans isomerase PrpF [Shewanella sp. SNU WT4]